MNVDLIFGPRKPLWGDGREQTASQIMIFVAAAVATYCAYYFLRYSLPVMGWPSFRIDFYATTVQRASDAITDSLIHSRPVSELYIFAQAIAAKKFFAGEARYLIYPVQHIVLIAYFFIITYVVARLYEARMSLSVAIAAWLIFMTGPGVMGNVYKLETIVGSISKIFGALSLLFIVRWHDRDNRRAAILAVVFYCLSIFSKEDFLIPPLVLLGWYLAKGNFQSNIRKHRWLIVSMIASLAFFFWFNEKLIPGRAFIDPVPKAESPYFMTLAPSSVFRVGVYYAFGCGMHAALLSCVFIAVAGTSVVMRAYWRQTLVVLLAIGGMMGPYLIMPNHVFSYYALNWTALEAIVSLLLLQFFLNRLWFLAPVFSLIVLAPNIHQLFQSRSETWYMAAYFRSTFTVSENIYRSLEANKVELNKIPVVGVTGVGAGALGQTPWQGNGETSFYFSSDLGLSPDWIVFVKSPTPNYLPGGPTRAKEGRPKVWVKNVSDIRSTNIPLLEFDNTGIGRLKHAGN